MRELKSELCDYAKKIALSESMVDESHFYDFRQNIFGGKMKPEFIAVEKNGAFLLRTTTPKKRVSIGMELNKKYVT